MKKTWNTINSALNRGRQINALPKEFIHNNITITDPPLIADTFNEFFVNVGTRLSSMIVLNNDTLTFENFLTTPVRSIFTLKQVSENEILNIINSMENKKSSGQDDLSNKLIKSIKNEISRSLTLIINQSLTTGIFPEALKISKVKPLFKNGDTNLLSNYRPISLLPTISKIFERVLHDQLYQYFLDNNLMAEEQYGFRKQHSTELATVKLIDNIISEMDMHKTPIAIFIDLSKAFDTLHINTLLEKLKFYGIKGCALTLFRNYFSNRYQYVKTDDVESSLLEVKTGIPQGSILGPLIFSIYINDLVKVSNIFKFLMYADDTTIYFSLEDLQDNKAFIINKELEKVNVWLKLNKLTINTEKTKFIIFHNQWKIVNPLQLQINNKILVPVESFTFLGVILDSNLSWHNHIDMVATKLSKVIGTINRLKHIFPRYILLTIYNSLIASHINYGSLVWGSKYKRIEKLQKRAIRTITNSNYIAHTEPLFKQLGLLKMQDMFYMKILKFLHKLYSHSLPHYFVRYVDVTQQRDIEYNLRPHALPLPPIKHVYAESCLSYQIVMLLNSTDPLIITKLIGQTHSFKGFHKYVLLKFLENYELECNLRDCFVCNRI